ncbi:hypothetical protein HHI36_013210, partial [Cryptolaemus montrouzieri]
RFPTPSHKVKLDTIGIGVIEDSGVMVADGFLSIDPPAKPTLLMQNDRSLD